MKVHFKCSAIELNMRREIPHLQATMYYFYHINKIALYLREKKTMSIIPKKKSLSALALRLKTEKCVE